MKRILHNGARREEFDLIGYGDGEIDNDYDEEVGGAENLWGSPDKLDAIEMAEEPFHVNNDTISELIAELEPGRFDDFAELAESLRDVLHENYADATPEEMQEALFNMMDTMAPAEGFNFLKVLRQIKVAPDQIRCVRAPCPSGTARITQTSPQKGSAAAAQLLNLFQNPDILKSLTALALGSHGRESIKVGKYGPAVNLGEYMNLLNTLVSKAAADADELVKESEETSAYRFDSEGYDLTDSTVAEKRSQALYDVLTGAGAAQPITEDAPKRSWSNFFPFKKGTKLLVEYEITGPDPNIGYGKVLERTSNLLSVKIHIDKWDLFNVPETDALIEIEYVKEGSGNRAEITVNGKNFTDNNVTIRSRKKTRWISMSISILGQKVDRIAVIREDSDEAKLKFKTGGEEHVLVLTKK